MVSSSRAPAALRCSSPRRGGRGKCQPAGCLAARGVCANKQLHAAPPGPFTRASIIGPAGSLCRAKTCAWPDLLPYARRSCSSASSTSSWSGRSAGWSSWPAVMPPRRRRFSCFAMRSRSCGGRSRARDWTGLTAPCSPPWPGCCLGSCDLVPQDQDLRVLGGVAAGQQRQPAEHPDHEDIDKADEHERRA